MLSRGTPLPGRHGEPFHRPREIAAFTTSQTDNVLGKGVSLFSIETKPSPRLARVLGRRHALAGRPSAKVRGIPRRIHSDLPRFLEVWVPVWQGSNPNASNVPAETAGECESPPATSILRVPANSCVFSLTMWAWVWVQK